MSVIASILVGAAAKVGAPVVQGILEKALGKTAGELAGNVAGKVIDEIAQRAGVETEGLPELAQAEPGVVEGAIAATEQDMPQLIELWSKGLDHQNALLMAETKEGFWQAAWRYGWMYLLAFLWTWRIVIIPVLNRVFPGAPIEAVETGILLTLTSWFIALYMGGHTVKELGKNVADAVRGWRR